jgi:hypothetical protein
MGQASRYWSLLLLDSSGRVRHRELPAVQAFLAETFPAFLEDAAVDEQLVRSLLPLIQTQPQARMVLRCLISHHVVAACQSLYNQFGQFYRFNLGDLLPLVLDDEGKPWQETPEGGYQTLAHRVFDRFDPSMGRLGTWVTRLVRQHPPMTECLLNHGLYLVSDWAILNDTKPHQLYRIWTQTYQFSPEEAERDCNVLEAFRLVYTAEHRPGARCKDPSPEQLERIAAGVAEKTPRPFSLPELQKHLTQICKRLRTHRILVRGGQVSGLSLEDTQTLERIQDKVTYEQKPQDEDQVLRDRLMMDCRNIFEVALPKAIGWGLEKAHKVFLNSPRRDTREKSALYFPAMSLFHCDRIPMGEIATRIGLKRQDDVSRLLNLNHLRAEIEQSVLDQCLHQIKPLLRDQGGMSFEQVDRAVEAIKAIFLEQIRPILEEEEQRTRTPKAFDRPTRFTAAICEALVQIQTERGAA